MNKINTTKISPLILILISLLLYGCGSSSSTTTIGSTAKTVTTSHTETTSTIDEDAGTETTITIITTVNTTTDGIHNPSTIETITETTTTITNLETAASETTVDSVANTVNRESEMRLTTNQIIDLTVIPAITQFNAEASSLNTKSQEFCADLSLQNLNVAQSQWQATHSTWFRVAPFLFGPANVRDARLTPIFWYIDSHRNNGTDYTGQIRTNITNLLGNNTKLDSSFFSNMTYNQVGLLSIEAVLFERNSDLSTDTSDILSEFESNDRNCNLLTGFTNELARQADLITNGWTGNYRETGSDYKTLLLNEQLEEVLDDETGESPIQKIIVSAQEYFDYLNKRDVSSSIAQISNNNFSALLASAQATNDLFNLTVSETYSLLGLIEFNGYQQDAETVATNLQAFSDAVNAEIHEDIGNYAVALDGNLKREIPDGLSLSLGLNFSDGD